MRQVMPHRSHSVADPAYCKSLLLNFFVDQNFCAVAPTSVLSPPGKARSVRVPYLHPRSATCPPL